MIYPIKVGIGSTMCVDKLGILFLYLGKCQMMYSNKIAIGQNWIIHCYSVKQNSEIVDIESLKAHVKFTNVWSMMKSSNRVAFHRRSNLGPIWIIPNLTSFYTHLSISQFNRSGFFICLILYFLLFFFSILLTAFLSPPSPLYDRIPFNNGFSFGIDGILCHNLYVTDYDWRREIGGFVWKW